MDKSKLIDKHLKGNHTLIHGNVHHFVVTGEVKGAFKGVLIEMLQEFEDSVRGQKTSNDASALPILDVRLSLPDIRNKLSPFKNLIAMLENGLMKGTIEVHSYIQKEMEQCKKSIAYLSGNES
jgi:hypothetical protein